MVFLTVPKRHSWSARKRAKTLGLSIAPGLSRRILRGSWYKVTRTLVSQPSRARKATRRTIFNNDNENIVVIHSKVKDIDSRKSLSNRFENLRARALGLSIDNLALQ